MFKSVCLMLVLLFGLVGCGSGEVKVQQESTPEEAQVLQDVRQQLNEQRGMPTP